MLKIKIKKYSGIFVYHTQPDDTSPQLSGITDTNLVPAVTPAGGTTSAQLPDRRANSTGTLVKNVLNTCQFQFTGELVKGVRAEERELFVSTYIDAKTGLLNRGGLNLFKRMIAQNRPVSVACLDADHFGAINEVCLKQKGDHCISIIGHELAQMVDRLQSQGHEVYAVLMGGEEFVVFGDVAKEQLAQELTKSLATIKTDINAQIDESERTRIAHLVFDNKYADFTDGLQRAEKEIGGITAGVAAFHFNARDDAGLAVRNSLLLTDEILTNTKKEGGRGSVNIAPDSIQETTHKADHFEAHNLLTTEQNSGFNQISVILREKIRQRFFKHTPRLTALMNNSLGDEKKVDLLTDFFTVPPFNMESAENVSQQAGFTVEELRLAKIELIHAHHDYGTYTGAATYRKLENLGDEYSAPRTLKAGEFKSINGAAGHTHGDTFLMWMFEDVIQAAIAECGHTADTVVVAQKGANFVYRMKKNLGNEKMARLEETIKYLYSHRIEVLWQRLNEGSSRTINEARAEWIAKDKQTTPVAERVRELNTLSITDYE